VTSIQYENVHRILDVSRELRPRWVFERADAGTAYWSVLAPSDLRVSVCLSTATVLDSTWPVVSAAVAHEEPSTTASVHEEESGEDGAGEQTIVLDAEAVSLADTPIDEVSAACAAGERGSTSSAQELDGEASTSAGGLGVAVARPQRKGRGAVNDTLLARVIEAEERVVRARDERLLLQSLARKLKVHAEEARTSALALYPLAQAAVLTAGGSLPLPKSISSPIETVLRQAV